MFAFVAACCYAFLIFHLIFTAAIENRQQAATFVTDEQRHWTTSATSSTNIRQVLVVASTKTQPKDQRVDLLHFVSANDRRSIRPRSQFLFLKTAVSKLPQTFAQRIGFSLGLKRESSERGIFRNIARVSFDR